MTDDVLEKVYNLLINDSETMKLVNKKNIKYFAYPATADVSENWVILEPIVNELPSGYSDGTWVTYDYLIHVEVWSRSRENNLELAKRVRDLLWDKLGFKQNDSTDEYDIGIYRDARRYEGTLHRSDLDKI